MKITIITPTFNSAETLEKSILSVLDQDYEELEYLFIDGGSTDGTLDLIEMYAENRSFMHWLSETDEGIADAFNKGLTLATGDWIGILNSDDCYTPGALAAVSEVASNNPEADVIYGNMQRIDDKCQPLFMLKPGPLDSSIWHEMPLNHPATFVSRRTYEKVGGFDVNLKMAMDYDLVLRLFQGKCRFVYMDKVLACMRYGGASDENLLAVVKEVYKITTKQGYSRYLAGYWAGVRLIKGSLKRALRALGLHSLLKLHPRFFRSSSSGD